MAMIFFNKQLNCPKCNEAILAVGNIHGEPMTKGSENVIAYSVRMGKLMTTEGPKEDIEFKVECPQCNHEINSVIIRDPVERFGKYPSIHYERLGLGARYIPR